MDANDLRTLYTQTSALVERTLREAEAMEALAALGEEGRAARSESKPIEVIEAGADSTGLSGRVQGTGAVYEVRITLTPKRGYRCTCPDSRRRGRVVGPCKHTLALARHHRAALQSDLDRIEGALVDCLF